MGVGLGGVGEMLVPVVVCVCVGGGGRLDWAVGTGRFRVAPRAAGGRRAARGRRENGSGNPQIPARAMKDR